MRCGADILGITTVTIGLTIMEMSGSAMAQTEDHEHSDYEVSTGLVCQNCGGVEKACAMCGVSLHICTQPALVERVKFRKGYRRSPDYPDYMVNIQAAVRYIPTGKLCSLIRVSSNGGAMLNLLKNGRDHIVSAQEVRNAAFPDRKPL